MWSSMGVRIVNRLVRFTMAIVPVVMVMAVTAGAWRFDGNLERMPREHALEPAEKERRAY